MDPWNDQQAQGAAKAGLCFFALYLVLLFFGVVGGFPE